MYIDNRITHSVLDESPDDYHIVMTDAEARYLKKKGIKAMTLYSFLKKGVDLYSKRIQIDNYRKERIRLSCIIAKCGKSVGPLSSQNLFSIMREIEKEGTDILLDNKKLKEFKIILEKHRKYLDNNILSINDVWKEAKNLLKEGKWFKIENLHIDNYPDIGRREKDILSILETRCNVIYHDPIYGDPEKVYAFPTKEDEVIGIARQILDINDINSCAVVLANIDGYLPIVKAIFDEYSIPYICEIDERLIKTKTFEFIMNLIDLVENDFRSSDIRRLFNSPIVEYRGLTPKDTDVCKRCDIKMLCRWNYS